MRLQCYTLNQQRVFFKMLKNGESLKDIAKEIGKSYKAVYGTVERLKSKGKI